MYIHIDTRTIFLPPAAFLRQKTCRKNPGCAPWLSAEDVNKEPGAQEKFQSIAKAYEAGLTAVGVDVRRNKSRNQWKKNKSKENNF